LADPYYDLDDERPVGPPRRYEDRNNRLREVAAAIIALCGGLALLFLFVALIGAVDPGEATGLAIAVAVFALIWLVGVYLRRRAGVNVNRVTRADRERRGF
jgi:Kef-type K+ transport system membrane component KefB